ncbi:MAG: AAA family ATPase [Stenotrophomonas sp.]
MLRILVRLGGHRDFVCKHTVSDENLADSLGLAHWVDTEQDDFRPSAVLAEVRQLHHQAEHKHRNARLPAGLGGNITRLSKLIELNDTDCQILEFATCLHHEPLLDAACDLLGRPQAVKIPKILATILGLSEAAVRNALAPQALLVKSGLVSISNYDGKLSNKLELISMDFAGQMFIPERNPTHLLRGAIAKAGKGHLKLGDYPHIQPWLSIALPYLRHATAHAKKGVNLLIHGKPGTGKTQLARTLAKAVACELFEVAHENSDGDAITGEKRLRAFRTAQCFLSKRRALMIFDEVEDVFDNGMILSDTPKARINSMLEENPVPTLWLSNNIRGMDPAFIRRFDMVFELPIPPQQQRAKILRLHCKGMLDEAHIARIAEFDQLAPAVVTRASQVVRAIRDDIGKENTASTIQRLIDNTLLAQGLPVLAQGAADRLPEVYDPAFIHADTNLGEVATGLRASRSGRLCLYGPPGTGKTAYGRWLARQLDMPLLVKRASDLMSPYVGESEQNIAAAFLQAEQTDALLLIDEVDSFLQDRRNAQRSWEVSLVNEMLTRMESFPGVFIASTNLLDNLDQAALRRFDLKAKFDFLRQEQAWELLCRHCAHLRLPPPDMSLQVTLKKLDRLTPGDYSAVARQHRFRPLATPAMLVAALQAECAVKEHTSRPIGFV